MATISFDERIVVTDPQMVEKMKRELESTESSESSLKTQRNDVLKSAQDNGKRWALRLLH